MFPSQRILANMGITISWCRGPGIGGGQFNLQPNTAHVHYCPGEGTPKAKTTAILQGGRLGGKRGVKAVQVEVFLPGTDDPPSLGRYPALCFVTSRGCSSFGFVGLVILIITFIRMFQMYFGGEGDFEVANR